MPKKLGNTPSGPDFTRSSGNHSQVNAGGLVLLDAKGCAARFVFSQEVWIEVNEWFDVLPGEKFVITGSDPFEGVTACLIGCRRSEKIDPHPAIRRHENYLRRD